MNEEAERLPWEEPNWLTEVAAWIDDQLAAHGWRATGSVELLHERPWSAFARVPTDRGGAYFKAPAPAFRYEAALTQALARWRPDCTAPLLAVDRERGWLLSADAGPTLRTASPDAEGQLAHWIKLLPFYAEHQIEMAEHVPELLALGVPDRRLAVLPLQYDQLLDDTEALRMGLEPGLTLDEHKRLYELRSSLLEWCDALAGYGLPETLTHEEVHDQACSSPATATSSPTGATAAWRIPSSPCW